MLEIADQLDRLDHAEQLAFSLCVVDRMCAAKSHFLDPAESKSFADLQILTTEIWEHLLSGNEITSEEYEGLRTRINSARPPSVGSFSLRNIFWILKSVLKVFRGREHAYEIARLGIESATQSKLDETLETHHQSCIIEYLVSLPAMSAENVEELRERIRELPIVTGNVRRAERRD